MGLGRLGRYVMMDIPTITTGRIGHNHLLGRVALATVVLAAAVTVGTGGVLASPTETDPVISDETQFDKAGPNLDDSLASDDNDAVSSTLSSVDEFPEADPVRVPGNAWDRKSEPLPLNG